MKIRAKIFFVVLPLLIVSLCLAETASYFSAVNGVTRVAQQFLFFKASQLEKYAESQWNLLADNNYESRPDMLAAAKEAVASYALSMRISATEAAIALDGEGNVVMGGEPPFAAQPFTAVSGAEKAALMPMLESGAQGLQRARIGGAERVFCAFYFAPFNWYVLLTEEYDAFYSDARRITRQTVVTLFITLAASAILLFVFARQLTRSLERVTAAMDGIIAGGNLDGRADVEYADETGLLAITFNTMMEELEKAYSRIKGQAFEAVLAQKKEERIRHIFQKYVPADLIDKFYASPESMLVGDNRMLAILFSDIRGFTTISEGLSPDELVKSLNRYFSGQVDIIYRRNGIVDKYIGDAIMAFWGAPLQRVDDPVQSVLSALEMCDAVGEFNAKQRECGKNEFHIGIGINYGLVTVGNIGSERKMDYTVIGDMVNLASRMEGLTKTYHSEILITESLREALAKNPEADGIPLRHLDTVAVKGKTKGVKIYTLRRSLSEAEAEAWKIHDEGMELYYRRCFNEAAAKFARALELIPGDFNAQNLLERCRSYAENPPPESWDGVEVMKTK